MLTGGISTASSHGAASISAKKVSTEELNTTTQDEDVRRWLLIGKESMPLLPTEVEPYVNTKHKRAWRSIDTKEAVFKQWILTLGDNNYGVVLPSNKMAVIHFLQKKIVEYPKQRKILEGIISKIEQDQPVGIFIVSGTEYNKEEYLRYMKSLTADIRAHRQKRLSTPVRMTKADLGTIISEVPKKDFYCTASGRYVTKYTRTILQKKCIKFEYLSSADKALIGHGYGGPKGDLVYIQCNGKNNQKVYTEQEFDDLCEELYQKEIASNRNYQKDRRHVKRGLKCHKCSTARINGKCLSFGHSSLSTGWVHYDKPNQSKRIRVMMGQEIVPYSSKFGIIFVDPNVKNAFYVRRGQVLSETAYTAWVKKHKSEGKIIHLQRTIKIMENENAPVLPENKYYYDVRGLCRNTDTHTLVNKRIIKRDGKKFYVSNGLPLTEENKQVIIRDLKEQLQSAIDNSRTGRNFRGVLSQRIKPFRAEDGLYYNYKNMLTNGWQCKPEGEEGYSHRIYPNCKPEDRNMIYYEDGILYTEEAYRNRQKAAMLRRKILHNLQALSYFKGYDVNFIKKNEYYYDPQIKQYRYVVGQAHFKEWILAPAGTKGYGGKNKQYVCVWLGEVLTKEKLQNFITTLTKSIKEDKEEMQRARQELNDYIKQFKVSSEVSQPSPSNNAVQNAIADNDNEMEVVNAASTNQENMLFNYDPEEQPLLGDTASAATTDNRLEDNITDTDVEAINKEDFTPQKKLGVEDITMLMEWLDINDVKNIFDDDVAYDITVDNDIDEAEEGIENDTEVEERDDLDDPNDNEFEPDLEEEIEEKEIEEDEDIEEKHECNPPAITIAGRTYKGAQVPGVTDSFNSARYTHTLPPQYTRRHQQQIPQTEEERFRAGLKESRNNLRDWRATLRDQKKSLMERQKDGRKSGRSKSSDTSLTG